MGSWRVGNQEKCKHAILGLGLIANPVICSEKLLYMSAAGATIFVAVFIFSVVNFIEWCTREPVIKYTIAVPNPPGDGRVTEKPSLKV